MPAIVKKPFTTVTQRFKPDAKITKADIQPPLDWADLKERGFIEEVEETEQQPTAES